MQPDRNKSVTEIESGSNKEKAFEDYKKELVVHTEGGQVLDCCVDDQYFACGVGIFGESRV
jgi:hypothetical protein